VGKAISAEGVGGPDYIFLPKPRIDRIRSDKDLQFTDALTKNGNERENLTGLIADKIIITKILIWAKQPLKFRLLLFSKDSFTDGDLDKDRFVTSLELDLSLYGELR